MFVAEMQYNLLKTGEKGYADLLLGANKLLGF